MNFKKAKNWFLYFLVLIVIAIYTGVIVMICRCNSVKSETSEDSKKKSIWEKYEKKIDVVFTYVDGNKRADTSPDVPRKRASTVGEIQYSVKQALIQPWCNRVFVVVPEGHTHEYLEKQPRVFFIEQDTLLPPEVEKPCKNSNVIEMFLHNIPTLSEIFVYFNDDMIMNKIHSADMLFLDEGKTLRFHTDNWGLDVFHANMLSMGLETTVTSRVHTHKVLSKVTGLRSSLLRYYPLPAHGPMVVDKALYMEALASVPEEEYLEACKHTSRESYDLVFMSYYWPTWCVHQKKGRWTSGYRTRYVHLNDTLELLIVLLDSAEKSGADIICINDSRSSNFEETDRYLKNWMQNRWGNSGT